MPHPSETAAVIDVLLVEDDVGDVLLTREAFAAGPQAKRLHVVSDGIEALEFLQREGRYGQAPRPALILLDLNLPRMDGHELLGLIKADPDLAVIPVVVVTTSTSDADVLRTYQLQANAYVPKPVDLDNYLSAVRSIESFYLGVARLPPGSGS